VAVQTRPPGTVHMARAAAVKVTCGAPVATACFTVSRPIEIISVHGKRIAC